MARDLKKLFEEERRLSKKKMPEGHEARFSQRLNEEFSEEKTSSTIKWYTIAAAVVIMLGLGFLANTLFFSTNPSEEEMVESKSLEDVSPELKKVEDYYLASINAELSRLEYTPETKELFDGYISRLGDLAEEYEKLSREIVSEGPTESTVTALIDNLKLRLQLLNRLKEKIMEINTANELNAIQG